MMKKKARKADIPIILQKPLSEGELIGAIYYLFAQHEVAPRLYA